MNQKKTRSIIQALRKWLSPSYSPRYKGGVWGWVFCFLLASCSTTANLPEGETLYTGISEIAYGRQAGQKQRKVDDETGVITALADAYQTVGSLLAGNADVTQVLAAINKDSLAHLAPALRDSVEQATTVARKALETAREEVDAALAYAPNNAMFGSSRVRWPMPVGLWIYNGFVNHNERGFGRWMFNTFAATPKFISSANPQLRVQVARNTLRNYGFFRGRVDYEVQPELNPRKAKLAYSVYPGPLFRLDSIEYRHFDTITDSLVRATASQRLLHSGDAFSVPNLDAERTRLSDLFRNRGFYFFRPEMIEYRADTLQKPFRVQLQVQPKPDMPPQAHNRFYIGQTTITLMKNGDYQLTDSTAEADFRMRWVGGGKTPLRLSAIRHNLFYRRGSLYRYNLHEVIQDKLANMGIFSAVAMSYTPRDTSATCDTLDVNIIAVLDKPFDSEFEAKVTNKSSGYVGPGLSYGITKRNAFRGAESLGFKVYGSYEWQTGVSSSEGRSSLLNSYELGAALTLTYPRIRVLGIQKILPRRAQTSTNFMLNADWLNRATYFQMVSMGVRVAYGYQQRRDIKHEIVPFRLDYDLLTHRTAKFDSIMAANPALYVSMRNQFVPSMGYTFTYSRPARQGHPRSLILTAKEAGNVVSGIYAAFGKDFYSSGKKLLGVPFAQFLKLTAEYRETWPITARTSLATRAFAGIIWSYGNSTMAPYADQFSIGGANSIRAFAARTIGPGSYSPAASHFSYLDQMGDFKLEANVEYRFPVISSLYGAVFVDAGNVWLLDKDGNRPGGSLGHNFGREIALGTGLGLRYDLDFIVLRFDVGVGLHAPYQTSKHGYYNMPRFRDSLGFHLAVGYPF